MKVNMDRRNGVIRAATLCILAAGAAALTIMPLAALGDPPPPGTYICSHGPGGNKPPVDVENCELSQCCKRSTHQVFDNEGKYVRTEYSAECVPCEEEVDPPL